jgi:hypothetical protein
MPPKAPSDSPSVAETTRAPWIAPRVDDLPRLTELTLQSGDIIDGDCMAGSTCF